MSLLTFIFYINDVPTDTDVLNKLTTMSNHLQYERKRI